MNGNKIGSNFQTTNNFDQTREQTAPTKTPVQTKVAQTDEYTVKRGDTLTEIAAKTGQNLRQLLERNPQIKNPNRISIGQHIGIGKPTNIYTVKKGDTLSVIARANHTSVGDIMRANPGRINNRNLIYPGQKLHLPTRETKTTTTKPETTTPTTTQPKPDDTKTQTPVGDKPPVDTGKTEPYARSPHLKLKTKGIELSPLVEKKMSQIADEYFRRTGKNLVITDGNRTARDQAERIYDKIQRGGENIYTNKKALAEIKAAYKEGAARGESREQIVNRMARTIKDQAGRNTYISKHLTGQGADVRISDMTASDRKAFLESVAKVGGARKIDEGNHWHMEIDENQKPPVQTPPPTPQTTPTAPTQTTTTAGNLKIAQIDLDDFLSPEKGSNAGFAVLIGNAEGNRMANGGFVKPNYYGHKDPGDGLWNIGSFSRANARFPNSPPARSPEEADKMHLQHMQGAKAKYVDAMNKAGLDPNNALLASVYFDAFNQSERAAAKMLAPENLNYLKGKELSIETMKEWRVGGFVNLQTGQRWKNASGSPVGGGLAKIANRETMKKYGRPATEVEIQQVIRRDQSRRVNEMIEPMKHVGLLRT